MQKSILLVEDDFLNRRLVRKVLLANGYTLFEAKNAKEAIRILNENTIDLIILDINLGKGEQDGISIAEQINTSYHLPFLFMTAYDTQTILSRAVATRPYSYLTKPFKNIDLIASIEVALKQFNKKKKKKITVRDGKYSVEIFVKTIDYIESDGNYIILHTDEKSYTLRATLKQVLEMLQNEEFVQVHRAYIVNKSKIEGTNKKYILIKGLEIPISKFFLDDSVE